MDFVKANMERFDALTREAIKVKNDTLLYMYDHTGGDWNTLARMSTVMSLHHI